MSVTTDEELIFSGPSGLADLVRRGEVTPRELVDLSLRRIEALNPRLNAFRTTMPEQALAEADAAGLVPCGTGSDGGGSIRIPAACCGLVGMKPTRGRVSTQPAPRGWLSLSVYGGLARTVRDSALMLDAMHGTVAGDLDSAP